MTPERGGTIWEKDYLTIPEASKYLRRYRMDVHDLIARRIIEVVDDGPEPLVRRADLDALLARLLEGET